MDAEEVRRKRREKLLQRANAANAGIAEINVETSNEKGDV